MWNLNLNPNLLSFQKSQSPKEYFLENWRDLTNCPILLKSKGRSSNKRRKSRRRSALKTNWICRTCKKTLKNVDKIFFQTKTFRSIILLSNWKRFPPLPWNLNWRKPRKLPPLLRKIFNSSSKSSKISKEYVLITKAYGNFQETSLLRSQGWNEPLNLQVLPEFNN